MDVAPLLSVSHVADKCRNPVQQTCNYEPSEELDSGSQLGGGLTRLVGSFFGVSVGHEQCGWTVHYRVDVGPFLGTTVGCRIHATAVDPALIVAEFKLVP